MDNHTLYNMIKDKGELQRCYDQSQNMSRVDLADWLRTELISWALLPTMSDELKSFLRQEMENSEWLPLAIQVRQEADSQGEVIQVEFG